MQSWWLVKCNAGNLNGQYTGATVYGIWWSGLEPVFAGGENVNTKANIKFQNQESPTKTPPKREATDLNH